MKDTGFVLSPNLISSPTMVTY